MYEQVSSVPVALTGIEKDVIRGKNACSFSLEGDSFFKKVINRIRGSGVKQMILF